jgi:uncharacterized protein (TIGR02611 family)
MNESMHKALRATYTLIIAILGTTLVLIGLALLFLPGPGMVVVVIGLGLLASEFAWARRLLRRAKKELEKGMKNFRQ